VERQLGIADTLAGLISDPRNPVYVTHKVSDILRARIFAIACGHEDADDRFQTHRPRTRTHPKPDEPEPRDKERPSDVRARLDEPADSHPPNRSRISGCKASEPCWFKPLRLTDNSVAIAQSQGIFDARSVKSQPARDYEIALIPTRAESDPSSNSSGWPAPWQVTAKSERKDDADARR
jgi:hypothetical protein